MHFLLQTTQPTVPSSWTPTAVIAVATAVITLVAATLIPALIKLFGAIKELKAGQTGAMIDAAENRGAIAAQSDSITRLAAKTDKALLAIDPNQPPRPPQ